VLASFWSIEKQTIKTLLTNLQDKDKEATDMLHLVAHQQRKLEFSQLDRQAAKSLESIDRVIEQLLEQKKAEILCWLSDADQSERQHILRAQIERNYAQSGHWILDMPEFTQWQQTPGSFLWLNGVSGCGKSSLCSTIIDQMERTSVVGSVAILAYWYFDNGNPKSQDLRVVLRSILRQISGASKVFPAAVRDMAAAHEPRGSKPDVQELFDVLKECIAECSEKIYLVIDALDECPVSAPAQKRSDLLGLISKLLEAGYDSLHLAITSIPEQDIKDHFHAIPKPPTEVNVEPLLFNDIGPYVDAAVERMSKSRPWWTPDLQEKIKSKLKVDEFLSDPPLQVSCLLC
jgi:hypothetical protein